MDITMNRRCRRTCRTGRTGQISRTHSGRKLFSPGLDATLDGAASGAASQSSLDHSFSQTNNSARSVTDPLSLLPANSESSIEPLPAHHISRKSSLATMRHCQMLTQHFVFTNFRSPFSSQISLSFMIMSQRFFIKSQFPLCDSFLTNFDFSTVFHESRKFFPKSQISTP